MWKKILLWRILAVVVASLSGGVIVLQPDILTAPIETPVSSPQTATPAPKG